jgi:hypothetical protein
MGDGAVIHKSVLYANVVAAQREASDGSVRSVEMAEGDLIDYVRLKVPFAIPRRGCDALH